MNNRDFKILVIDEAAKADIIEQLVALMTRMYDFHASLHPDWRTKPGWQQGSRQWLSRAASSGDWFAALAYPDGSDTPCGYVLASFHYEAPLFLLNRFGYIADLWVNEEYRGMEVSGLLLESAFSFFRQQGVSRIQLEVDSRNERALNYWHKQGFEDFQIVMRRDTEDGHKFEQAIFKLD